MADLVELQQGDGAAAADREEQHNSVGDAGAQSLQEMSRPPMEHDEQPYPHMDDIGGIPVVIMEHTDDGSGGHGVVSEWMQCRNEHGEGYFCNICTGETRWQLPTAASEGGGSSSDGAARLDAEGGALPGTEGAEDADGADDAVGDPDRVSVSHAAQRKSLQLVKQVMNGAIKRLDRNVQMQLEETRRRHHELEDLRDEEVRLGGEHWVEMYDPTHDCFYYYGMFSGEMSWDRPESYVMKAENDAVLRTIVKLQCAFRMKLARKRVFQMKVNAQRQRQQQAASSGDDGAPPDPEREYEQEAENVWIEVYDPFHKVLYYYCSSTGESRWDPPTYFISANEDKEMAAAIAIQSLSRSFLARRDVKQRRLTLRKKRQEQAVEETRRIRALRRKEFFLKSEDERSSICRREMIEEEMEQIKSGDRFWGIDAHDREVRRQQTEERMMVTAEMFWQRVNLAMHLRGELNGCMSKEEEGKRREQEVMAEALARDAMSAEEAQQRQLNDNFWGIHGEERREERARREMADEELLSRCFGQDLHVCSLHIAWREEAAVNAERSKRDKVIFEKKYQQKYMKWFYQDCTTVDDLLEYLWPTKKRFVVPPPSSAKKQNAHGVLGGYYSTGSSPTYVLDDLVVRERLAHGDLRYGRKSIFTIHHPNSAQILGRKGGFTMEKVGTTKSVFEQTAAMHLPLHTSPNKPARQERSREEEEEEEHVQMGTAVHYQRAKVRLVYFPDDLTVRFTIVCIFVLFARLQTPDPHLPARFNGMPFKPSQISPTRDILCSEHTKRNQLPSLSAKKPKHSKQNQSPTSKSKTQSKSKLVLKTKKENHFGSNNNSNGATDRNSSFLQRHLSIFSQEHQTVDPMMTAFGFVGPYANEGAQRHQRHRVEEDDDNESGASDDDERFRDDGDNAKELEDARDGTDGATVEAQETARRQRRQLRMQQFSQQFAREEHDVLRHLFVLMDADGSGTINKHEMMWALQRDEEICALATKSLLLRALLKQHVHLEELFAQLQTAPEDEEEAYHRHRRHSTKRKTLSNQQAELSWDVFVGFCERMYVDLMEQGLLGDANSDTTTPLDGQHPPPHHEKGSGEDDENGSHTYKEEEEEQTIRNVFALLDNDGNGVLDVDELQHALYDTTNVTIHTLVSSSRALQPLLHQELFMDAFRKFETEDPRGISQEEFVGLCLEIASIAQLNGML